MRIVSVVKIKDEFGVLRDIEVGLDFVGDRAIQFCGAVDIEVIVGFGRGGKMSLLESGGSEIADATIRNEDVATSLNRGGSGEAVGGWFQIGIIEGSSET